MKEAIPDVQRMIPKIDSILSNIVTLTSDPALTSTLHNANKISSDLNNIKQTVKYIVGTT